MGRLLKSWFFFTALLVLLAVAGLTVPELSHRFFGDTEGQLTKAASQVESQVQAVWGELQP